MCGRGLLVLAAVLGTSAAQAAQVFYQPLASLGVENDSNLDMDPGGSKAVQGYLADVATVVGIDTPEWSTLLRPRLVYRSYPKSSVDDRLETYPVSYTHLDVYKRQGSNRMVDVA